MEICQKGASNHQGRFLGVFLPQSVSQSVFGNLINLFNITGLTGPNSSEVLRDCTAGPARSQRPWTSRSPSSCQAQCTPLPWCQSSGRRPSGPAAKAPGAGRSNTEGTAHSVWQSKHKFG